MQLPLFGMPCVLNSKCQNSLVISTTCTHIKEILECKIYSERISNGPLVFVSCSMLVGLTG